MDDNSKMSWRVCQWCPCCDDFDDCFDVPVLRCGLGYFQDRVELKTEEGSKHLPVSPDCKLSVVKWIDEDGTLKEFQPSTLAWELAKTEEEPDEKRLEESEGES